MNYDKRVALHRRVVYSTSRVEQTAAAYNNTFKTENTIAKIYTFVWVYNTSGLYIVIPNEIV